MKFFHMWIFPIAIALAATPTALAQDVPEATTLFNDFGAVGIFCSYQSLESEDVPDTVSVYTGMGIQELFTFFRGNDYERVLKSIATLSPGTPITFGIKIDYFYYESEGQMRSMTGMTGFAPIPDARAEPTPCMAGGEPDMEHFYAKSLLGHFCGFEPARDSTDVDRVTVRTRAGTFRLTPKLNTMQDIKALSELTPGTPILYDIEFVSSTEGMWVNGKFLSPPPPAVSIRYWRSNGEPDPGVCVAER